MKKKLTGNNKSSSGSFDHSVVRVSVCDRRHIKQTWTSGVFEYSRKKKLKRLFYHMVAELRKVQLDGSKQK